MPSALLSAFPNNLNFGFGSRDLFIVLKVSKSADLKLFFVLIDEIVDSSIL
jgi:hypothetical protein